MNITVDVSFTSSSTLLSSSANFDGIKWSSDDVDDDSKRTNELASEQLFKVVVFVDEWTGHPQPSSLLVKHAFTE